MQEEDPFVFRSDNEERLVIAERNKQAAASILSQAGISEDNPLYNQYYAHTLANVHHAGRYGGYDKQIEQMFVETLQDPELSLEQYKEASKRFEAQFAEKQMQNATGSVFNEAKNNTPFHEMRSILNKTTLDGVEMRNSLGTTFPKEFYDENGSLKRRLVVEIPPELMGNSAMGAIGTITKEYENISFDRASNSFMVKGKPIGPEKFFKNKKELLDKFDAEKLDMSDTELLGVLQEGDYNKFLELRKNRGMNRDRRNEMLRNVLNDEVVLGEVSKKFRNTELNKQNISDVVKSVAEDFGSKAQIVRTESEKATLGGIDRVMFSVSPADVARQSTFQDWKSCMHAVGCNHRYVDDSIGVGSIVAYGYSSDDPQKMVSRLLIHPYTSNKGTVAYGVNDRIYGKENLAFREVVNKVVTEKFNAGKIGAFKLNSNLYNDNAGKNILGLFPADMKNVDWHDFVVDGKVDLSGGYGINLVGVDLSHLEELKLPNDIKSLEGITLPKKVDLSDCAKLNLNGADLSQVEEVKLPSNIESLEGISFPKKIDLSNCSELNLVGVDLSHLEELKLPSGIKSLEGVKLPKKLDISSCYNLNLEGADLSAVENLKVSGCENMDLSNFNGKLEFSQRNIGIMNSKLPPSMKSLDLSGGLSFISETNLDGIEELKLPEHVIVGSMDDAEKQMMELCDGNTSKLESMAVAGITPESVPNNLKRLDISACKDIDLRNWNLDKIEELKLPKDFDVSKLPEGIMEKNPAVARAVKISRGEAVEDLVQTSVGKENAAISEPKAEVKAKNATAERISQLRGVNQSSAAAKTGENIIEKVAEKTVVHAGVNAGKTSEGIIDTLAKADNAVNQAIDKTIDKGSELLNNTAVGKVYEKATDAIANTKVVKAVEKGAAKTVEKAAQTAVGKSVVKTVAKTTGSAVGKSVLKKVPLVSVAAGCYFAWDRAKDGDWKGACGEIASGIAGCFPGVGTAASAAIDVGLAAKDISGAIAEAKEPEASKSVTEEDSGKSKEDMRQIILQKQGRVAAESKTPVKSSEISNQVLQQRMVQQGRG